MDDNFDDYFMEDGQQTKTETSERKETPQEREEREIAEATIERRGLDTIRIILIGAITMMVLFLAWWTWTRFYHPYEKGQYKGWVIHMAAQGSVFKTYEGQMLAIAYADDNIVKQDTLNFTITSDSLAREAMRWNADGRRLIMDYERYKGTLPWRGASHVVLTDIVMDSDRIERMAPVPVPANETR